MAIRKVGSKFVVTSRAGKVLGAHVSRKKAVAHQRLLVSLDPGSRGCWARYLKSSDEIDE